MGLVKRERVDDGEVEGKKVKITRDDGEKAVTVTLDNEVEEFYAILRRARVAVKYFKKGNSQKWRDLTETKRWRSFQPEDLEGDNGVSRREKVKDDLGLDLNVDPSVDDHMVSKSIN